MTVRQNVDTAKSLEKAVREHCMCLRYEATGTHYRVLYPHGYFPEGVQAHKGLGKIEAHKRLLDAMERHWRASFA